MKPQLIDLPPLSIRADVGTVHADARSVDLVFSTGAAVDRMDYWTGKRYSEVLSMDPKHIRLDRLNAGAPLLDAHSAWSVGDVLGAVEPGTARIEKGQALATVRFSKRDAVNDIWGDVQDGIIRSVSVGYRVHKFMEETPKGSEIPTRTAIDWEPYEVSMVPMPADTGAKVRSGDKSDTNTCVILTRDAEEHTAMDDVITQTPPVEAPAPAAPADAEVRATAAAAERARVLGIQDMCRIAKIDPAFGATMVANGTTLDAARAAIFAKLAADEKTNQPDTRSGLIIGEDAKDKWIRGMTNWLLVRSGVAQLVAKYQKADVATIDPGEFRGMTLSDIARMALEHAGQLVRGLSRLDLFGRALTFRGNGMNTTSDFATLLESVLNKTLLGSYAITPDTWSRMAAVKSASDFRAQNFYRNGAFGTLDSLNEHGEFQNKSIPDGEKTTFTVAPKGNIIAITRQALINDDMGAFTDLAQRWGRAAKLSIESDFYALLALNSGLGPTQTDGQAFFHANRANVGTGAAIAAAALDSDAAVMAAQKDPSGNEYLDLRPTILLVPRTLQGQASVINDSQYDPDTLANKAQMKPNFMRGFFQDIVGTARLSGTRRYLFADPAVSPAVVVAFLDGRQEPVLEQQDGWRVDGTEMKVRIDYGVSAVDPRGAVTNAGA